MIENIIVVRTTSEPEVWDQAERLPFASLTMYTTTYDLTTFLHNTAVVSALTWEYYAGMRFGMTHPDVARTLVRALSWSAP